MQLLRFVAVQINIYRPGPRQKALQSASMPVDRARSGRVTESYSYSETIAPEHESLREHRKTLKPFCGSPGPRYRSLVEFENTERPFEPEDNWTRNGIANCVRVPRP